MKSDAHLGTPLMAAAFTGTGGGGGGAALPKKLKEGFLIAFTGTLGAANADVEATRAKNTATKPTMDLENMVVLYLRMDTDAVGAEAKSSTKMLCNDDLFLGSVRALK